MSTAVAPLAATTPSPPPPAQDLYLDPFVVLYENGQRLSKSAVVAFGQVAQNGAPITKTISLYYSQGNPANTQVDGYQFAISSNQTNNIAALQSDSVSGSGADIVSQFQSHKLEISNRATVVIESENEEWLVKNGDKYYLIVRDTDGNLDVSRYHFVIDSKDTGANGTVASIAALVTDLESNKLTANIIDAFRAFGYSLRHNTTVQTSTPAISWTITSGAVAYQVTKDASGTLTVAFRGKGPTGEFPPLGGVSAPSGFIVPSPIITSDKVHATLTITFDPEALASDIAGPVGGTIVIPIVDGSNYVIALNVKATVLPTAAVSVTRIDMGRLPKIAGNSFRIGGVPENGLAHVQLTNSNTTFSETGAVNVVLYASTSDTLDTTDALVLGTGSTTLTIKADRSKAVKVPFKFPVLQQSADYHVFAVATGSTLIAPSGAQYGSPILLPIAAPEINLSGIATQSPAFLTRNTTRINVPIANSGNVRAQANVQLTIYTLPPPSEPGASSSPSLLGTFDLSYSIDPGREAIRTLNLGRTVPAGFEILAVINAVRLPAATASLDTSNLPDSFAVR